MITWFIIGLVVALAIAVARRSTPRPRPYPHPELVAWTNHTDERLR